MDDRLVEEFFGGLENLDSLGARLPRKIQRVRKRWSEADARHLPRLADRLRKALDCPRKTPPNFQGATDKVNSEMAALLCLEAICAIQPCPEDVPLVVRNCLYEPDYSLRAKALG